MEVENTNSSQDVYIAGIVQDSLVDGPGLRTTIFFSGCSVRCAHCHNAKYIERDTGIKMSLHELVERIKRTCVTKKITISGGEPLEQPEGVLGLIAALPDYDIGLYTSYELSDVDSDILKNLSFVKTGRFVKEQKITNEYFGSSNQKLILLR
ncbi:TPA: radical SAM protein [Vibrio vulnificus]|uniref:4Fe-4S single cluster domain-containing protein n=1 Tax=Vibrio vulnificus TaxID=672 RepID=UPI0005F158CC|nr:4Fe-4S single cluster domain-containing protein [Vibrio vulnificus]MCA3914498.1 radical SAM protein [Vibrio vulnificus]MCG6313194.1 radical SAM protein [Vibrio vulnificus]HAS6361811.1 4Fe-4S cluster-binding domain-containing protein [Vibrio vulnificus]HDY7542398.1 radical SAM protein [Vibrio vulnificus]HDY7683772.1 radical SAM protein [Vibrio vulnificus]